MDTFLSFDITEGQHEIKMVYVSVPFYGGLAITLAGIGLFVLLIILEKKKGFMVIPVWKKESVPNIDGDIGDSADEQPLTDNTPTVTDNASESTEAPAEECSCEPENNSDTQEE